MKQRAEIMTARYWDLFPMEIERDGGAKQKIYLFFRSSNVAALEIGEGDNSMKNSTNLETGLNQQYEHTSSAHSLPVVIRADRIQTAAGDICLASLQKAAKKKLSPQQYFDARATSEAHAALDIIYPEHYKRSAAVALEAPIGERSFVGLDRAPTIIKLDSKYFVHCNLNLLISVFLSSLSYNNTFIFNRLSQFQEFTRIFPDYNFSSFFLNCRTLVMEALPSRKGRAQQ